MARPRKRIDAAQVRRLASIGCTTNDIAYVVDCSKDTLERRYAAAIEKGRAEGRTSLRRKQFALAMKGNGTMLVWLGKNLLGQRDRADVTSGEGSLAAPAAKVVFYIPRNGRELGARADTFIPGNGAASGNGWLGVERRSQRRTDDDE